jgi:hypothetical protein
MSAEPYLLQQITSGPHALTKGPKVDQRPSVAGPDFIMPTQPTQW